MSGLSAAPILPGSIGLDLMAQGAIAEGVAAIAPGQIGSHVVARRSSGAANIAHGDSIAGSNIAPVSLVSGAKGVFPSGSIVRFPYGAALSGTWRCLGLYQDKMEVSGDYKETIYGAALFVRIA